MIKTNAIFHRKMIQIEAKPCVIEAIELMNQEQYDTFSRNMLADRAFIRDRKKDMYVDENGTMHCLLVLNEDSGDGLIIDSSGYDYARYVGFMPNIKPYIDQQISHVADQIFKEASENTSNGSWAVFFDEIEEHYDLSVTANNGIGTLLLNELQSREEIAEILLEDNCFDLTLYLDFCKNLNPDEHEQNMGM